MSDRGDVAAVVLIGVPSARCIRSSNASLTRSTTSLQSPSRLCRNRRGFHQDHPRASRDPAPGIADAVRSTAAPVVGVSPIIADAPVRGMADACLSAIGVETSAYAVASHYGARSAGGVLDGWLVDDTDAAAVDKLSAEGIRARAVPLFMTDVAATAAIAEAALELAAELRT